jgi:multidrug efflux pump subunit AcrA (membrane-fusion protein)
MMEESRLAELERRLQEAEQRAEEERQRAEEAERERQEERQRAEKEQQRAEKEQQRAEKEQQRAEEAEREREEERHRAELSERQTSPTTLNEYILACHTSVFSKLAVETNPRLTSKGSITNPRGKWCPTSLRPWSDFLGERKAVFGTLDDTFPAEARVFETISFLEGLGARISRRKIADEKGLEYFLHNSVGTRSERSSTS